MNEKTLYSLLEMLGASMESEELEKVLYSMSKTEIGDIEAIHQLLDFYGIDIKEFDKKFNIRHKEIKPPTNLKPRVKK